MRRRLTYKTILAPVSVLALLALTGCRNPFVPAADVSLMTMLSNGIPEIQVLRLGTQLTEDSFDAWKVTAYFIVSNRVGVNISRVNIVYTNMLGEEVTTYITSGGKSYKLLARLQPVSNTSAPWVTYLGWGMITTIPLFVVDRNVYTTLENLDSENKVIIAHVTFWGEDDNGYDVKLSSQITIKGFDF